MLFENQSGQKLTDPVTVKNLDDVHFLRKSFIRVVMPFHSFQSMTVAFAALYKAATESLKEGCSDVLCISVVISTSLGYSG